MKQDNTEYKYKVQRTETKGNYIPEGTKMASKSKTFKAGDTVSGYSRCLPNDAGYIEIHSDGVFRFSCGRGSNLKQVVDVVANIENTIKGKTPVADSDAPNDSVEPSIKESVESSIESSVETLEKTKKIHYLLVGGAVTVGASIGLGVSALMHKTAKQKVLFTVVGAALAVIPTIVYLAPIYKEVNIKLKNLKTVNQQQPKN